MNSDRHQPGGSSVGASDHSSIVPTGSSICLLQLNPLSHRKYGDIFTQVTDLPSATTKGLTLCSSKFFEVQHFAPDSPGSG